MHRVRFLAESKLPLRNITDALTGQRIFWWRGSDVRFEIAVTDNGQHLLAGDIGTLIVEVKNLTAGPSDAAVMRKEFGEADCDATFTAADWNGGVKALLFADFTDAEAALAPGHYRIIVRHEDPAGLKNTYCSSEIEVIEDHSESSSLSAPPTPGSEYWNKTEADTRYARTSALAALDADVTAAETSIAALAIREEPILLKPAALNAAFHAFQGFDDATPAAPHRVTLTGFGDSMPGYVANWFLIDLAAKYGVGILFSGNLGISWNQANIGTLAGGAATLPNDYTILPNAGLINLPAGGSYTVTVPEPSGLSWLPSGMIPEAEISTGRNVIPLENGIRTVRVFYVRESGAGTITATLTQTQFANVTATASAANGSEALGFLDLAVPEPFAAFTIAAAASSAAVRLIGYAFLSGSGVGWISSSKGSTTMDDQLPGLRSSNTVWNPVYLALLANLNTPLVIHAQRATNVGAEANNAATNYARFFDAFTAARLAQVYFEEPHRRIENALTSDAINATVLGLTRSRPVAYFARKRLNLGGPWLTTMNGVAPTAQPSITALTGGAGTALDGQATTSLPVGTVWDITISGTTSTYVLTAGTDGESVPALIRPDDYNASTNAKVWKQFDEIHRSTAAHRFEVGQFLHAVNDFRSGGGRAGSGPLTRAMLTQERHRFFALTAAQRVVETWHNGRTLDDVVTSTYAAPTVDSERGFKLASTAALGHVNCRPCLLSLGDSTLRPDVGDLFIAGGGFRNVTLVAGLEAFLAFGTSTTGFNTLAGLTQRIFGLHFAWGTSIGLGFGGQEFVRLFVCDGTTTTFSRWVPLASANGVASGQGCRFAIRWDRSAQMLTCAIDGNTVPLATRLSLSAPSLAANSTTGSWVRAGLFAANTDFGNGAGASPTPASASGNAFQWQKIIAEAGGTIAPYAI